MYCSALVVVFPSLLSSQVFGSAVCYQHCSHRSVLGNMKLLVMCCYPCICVASIAPVVVCLVAQCVAGIAFVMCLLAFFLSICLDSHVLPTLLSSQVFGSAVCYQHCSRRFVLGNMQLLGMCCHPCSRRRCLVAQCVTSIALVALC